MPTLKIVQMPHAQGLDLPDYQSAQAAGFDLCAAVEASVELESGQFTMVPTGLMMALPEGYEGQVRPRSGLAAKHGVTVLNSPGTVDADYRGEVKVILINHSASTFTIERGMRIAQMVVAPVTQVRIEKAEDLELTVRGSGGFGSSGLK